jgi:hypothetical protein
MIIHEGLRPRIIADERDAYRATLTHVNTRQIRRKPVRGGLIHEYTHAA